MFADGFLGQGAPWGADLNLLLQVVVGILLFAGMGLARRGRHGAHGICQSAGFVLAVVMTILWMIPAFHAIHSDALGRGVVNRVTIAVTAHVVVGTTALLVGAWVVLVAGTPRAAAPPLLGLQAVDAHAAHPLVARHHPRSGRVPLRNELTRRGTSPRPTSARPNFQRR